MTTSNSARLDLNRFLLDLCSDAALREEWAKLLDDPSGGEAATVPFLRQLVRERILDRIAARAAYLIASGELDPSALKEVLPPRPLRARREAALGASQELPPTLEPGDVVGRSVVESLLCAGPNGALYRATHAGLVSPVVVKVAAPGRPTDQLRNEARVLAEVAHRNVVRLWDAGTHAGFPFLAVEYLPNGSLKDELASRGPLAPGRVIQAACEAVRGLQAARTAGFVHGDVKPGNLLVAADGTVKVADFGTARRVNSAGAVPVDVIDGSWPYLAPERFGSFWDHRVDVYSLGLTIYGLLTGAQPVAARTPHECLKAHRELSLEPLHWTVPGLTRSASALFLKMAARDPADRPPSYDDLLAELSRLRDEPASETEPDSEGVAT